uniref:UNC-45/Cro1/She4 central domain-containing protein n=1 Tax=Corethron hystrix TaxID=216773 RepID=A0A7S1FV44_9STRA|mmetsp:Transcript_34419/g.79583  ORF Transcript_34419/g.79583 Transcript_34419/m.79583 type:complete len:520 (+) Transcript_34419:322-1881(+)
MKLPYCFLAGLKLAATQKETLVAVEKAKRVFDHNNTNMHDEEVRTGAASALYKQLCLAFHTSESKGQLKSITTALEMVFRCSTQYLIESYNDIGEGLLKVLIPVIHKELSNPKDCNSGVIGNCSKIIKYFSHVDKLKVAIASQEGVILTLVHILGNKTSDEARYDAMHALIGLAMAEENMVLMAHTEGVLEELVCIAKRREESDQMRRWSGAALWSLSGSIENKELMCCDEILSAIDSLCDVQCQRTVAYMISLIKELSKLDKNNIPLVAHNNGSLLRRLVEMSTNDEYGLDSIRKSVMTLDNLICPETAQAACSLCPLTEKRPGLIVTLTSVVLDNDDPETRNAGLSALAEIATTLQAGCDEYDTLLQCLVSFLASEEVKFRTMAVLALKDFASVDCNRPFLTDCEGLLEGVAQVALKSRGEERADCLNIICDLTCHEESRQTIVLYEDVLRLLADGAMAYTVEEGRDKAMESIINLSLTRASRKVVAENRIVMITVLDLSHKDERMREAFKRYAEHM